MEDSTINNQPQEFLRILHKKAQVPQGPEVMYAIEAECGHQIHGVKLRGLRFSAHNTYQLWLKLYEYILEKSPIHFDMIEDWIAGLLKDPDEFQESMDELVDSTVDQFMWKEWFIEDVRVWPVKL